MSVWNKRLKILDGSKARVENDFGGFMDSIPVGMERQIDDVKLQKSEMPDDNHRLTLYHMLVVIRVV